QRDDPVGLAPYRLPEDLLFPARSTEYLPRCYRKRRAPSRAKWFLSLANTQNCDAWRVRSIPTSIGLPQQGFAHSGRDPRPKPAPWLLSSYPSAPLLLRSLRPSRRGKRRSLRNATRTWPHKPDRRRLALCSLPHESEHFPSAKIGRA